MAIVKIDAADNDLFKPREFRLLPKGKFLLEVKGPSKGEGEIAIEMAKSGKNNVVNIRHICIDDREDGKFKGVIVFHTITLDKNFTKDLVHLALACQSQTPEDIKANGVNLALLKGRAFEAEINLIPPSKAPDGSTYKEKNEIARYLFEPVETA